MLYFLEDIFNNYYTKKGVKNYGPGGFGLHKNTEAQPNSSSSNPN